MTSSATASTSSSTSGPIYFWREYESPYGFLSQWYPSAFTASRPSHPGTSQMTFLTTEQYMYVSALFLTTLTLDTVSPHIAESKGLPYLSPLTGYLLLNTYAVNGSRMYHKALLFNDPETANAISLEPEPSKQKALGRQVKHFDKQQWKKKREKIVEEGNWWKFTQPKEGDLRGMLLETGDRMLVEASPYDRIWGIGYGAADADGNRGTWGENLLGKALMRVRERLRAGLDGTVDENGVTKEPG